MTNVSDGWRVCTECLERKPHSHFSRKYNGNYNCYCRECVQLYNSVNRELVSLRTEEKKRKYHDDSINDINEKKAEYAQLYNIMMDMLKLGELKAGCKRHQEMTMQLERFEREIKKLRKYVKNY